MDKKKLVQAFIAELENELAGLKAAAMSALEAATHEETKPENQYDTFALEASYLAGAQAKRAGEIDEILSMFVNLPVKQFSPGESVSSTALVEIISEGKKRFVFLMPKGGGFSLLFEKQNIQVITPASHLGEALLDRKKGEEFEVEIGDQVKEYQVLSIF